MANSPFSNDFLTKVPVNNALLDPMQGFDADVFALDQATGNYALVGRFTSIQITFRNTTEPYLELNQRIPRLLDGDIQIGWVLERGQLDTRILQQTFGFNKLNRAMRFNRFPRMQISFTLQAPELHTTPFPKSGQAPLNFGNSEQNKPYRRQAEGNLLLTMCKVDTFTMGATAGRSVIANRWEGMAEGIEETEANKNVWAGIYNESNGAYTALDPTNNSSAFNLAKNIKPFSYTGENDTANGPNNASNGSNTGNPGGGGPSLTVSSDFTIDSSGISTNDSVIFTREN